MTNHRSDSQSKLADVAKVVRLVDVKSARKEATPPFEGIRPTKQGPWDPCRFQEYEVSPEFRLQIMSAKPPPADPELFEESLIKAALPELAPSNIPVEFTGVAGSELIEVAGERSESKSAGVEDSSRSMADSLVSAPVAVPESRAPGFAKRSTRIKLIVMAGALLGLLIGYAVARSKSHESESTRGTVPLPAPSAAANLATRITSTPVGTNPQRTSASGSSETLRPTTAAKNPAVASSHPLKASPSVRTGNNIKKAFPKATPTNAEDSEPAWVEPK